MQRALRFIETTAAAIAKSSARHGQRVTLDANVLDRSDSIALGEPGRTSANRSARLLRAADGWIAANLPREDDLAAIPALLECQAMDDPWSQLETHAPRYAASDFVARAETLGLALAALGETRSRRAPAIMTAVRSVRERPAQLRVIDLSSLWAGPLCGGVFAAMGADVVKLESTQRPDPTPRSAPALDARLNGKKRREAISFTGPEARAALRNRIDACDILITSARARALTDLGLDREHIAHSNPSLIWVAMTGHGWSSNRIAFGDDAAIAGNLVAWRGDEPHFLGDAIADPLTGLAAAAAALWALDCRVSGFIDVSLARTAAHVANLT